MKGIRGLGITDYGDDSVYYNTGATPDAAASAGGFWGDDGFGISDITSLLNTGAVVYNTVTKKYTTPSGQPITQSGGQYYLPPGYSPAGSSQNAPNQQNQAGSGMSTGVIIALSAIGLLGVGTVVYLATKKKG